MASILEVKTIFNNFSGAPGYNQLYFNVTAGADHGAQDAYAAAYAFWNNVVVQMSEGITFAVQGDVKELDPLTGTATVIWNVITSGQSNFASAGPYAGGSGAVVNWKTGVLRVGHLLKGRTFIVPLGASSYQSDGTLATATVSALNTHAANLLTATADLCVGPPVGHPRAGTSATATSFQVRDHVAQLRSRRD